MDEGVCVDRGIVFNIQRFSIHDGPGIRTTVFLKGCSLYCPWCSNPEARRGTPEVFLRVAKCIKCGRCQEACPEHAIVVTEVGATIDRHRCTACLACTTACPSRALEATGQSMSVAERLGSRAEGRGVLPAFRRRPDLVRRRAPGAMAVRRQHLPGSQAARPSHGARHHRLCRLGRHRGCSPLHRPGPVRLEARGPRPAPSGNRRDQPFPPCQLTAYTWRNAGGGLDSGDRDSRFQHVQRGGRRAGGNRPESPSAPRKNLLAALPQVGRRQVPRAREDLTPARTRPC